MRSKLTMTGDTPGSLMARHHREADPRPEAARLEEMVGATHAACLDPQPYLARPGDRDGCSRDRSDGG